MFGGSHWTDRAADATDSTTARRRQAAIVDLVLEPLGLRCSERDGRLVVTGPSGRSRVVDHLGALWPAAERLAGQPIDPLEPQMLERLERSTG
jgi:hypothetical protein